MCSKKLETCNKMISIRYRIVVAYQEERDESGWRERHTGFNSICSIIVSTRWWLPRYS